VWPRGRPRGARARDRGLSHHHGPACPGVSEQAHRAEDLAALRLVLHPHEVRVARRVRPRESFEHLLRASRGQKRPF